MGRPSGQYGLCCSAHHESHDVVLFMKGVQFNCPYFFTCTINCHPPSSLPCSLPPSRILVFGSPCSSVAALSPRKRHLVATWTSQASDRGYEGRSPAKRRQAISRAFNPSQTKSAFSLHRLTSMPVAFSLQNTAVEQLSPAPLWWSFINWLAKH